MGHPILGDDLYHEASSYLVKSHRLAQISKAATISSPLLSSSSTDVVIKAMWDVENKNFPRIPNFPTVRRGRGLFLMSTAVQFEHPRYRGHRVEVECDLAPRFHRAIEKARRGSMWIENVGDGRVSSIGDS